MPRCHCGAELGFCSKCGRRTIGSADDLVGVVSRALPLLPPLFRAGRPHPRARQRLLLRLPRAGGPNLPPQLGREWAAGAAKLIQQRSGRRHGVWRVQRAVRRLEWPLRLDVLPAVRLDMLSVYPLEIDP